MAVRTRVGLGDREGHLLARREWLEPPVLLRVGPELREQLAADRRGDEDQEERTALRRELLGDDRELAQTAAATAMRLRQVDGEKPELGNGIPELVDLFTAAGTSGVVGVPELGGDVAHRAAQELVFGRVGELHSPERTPERIMR